MMTFPEKGRFSRSDIMPTPSISYGSLTNIYFFCRLVPFPGRLCYGITSRLLLEFNSPEKIKGGMNNMKPKGTWIAICIILAVGLFMTDYVKKRTEGTPEMAATAYAFPSEVAEGTSKYQEAEDEPDKADKDGQISDMVSAATAVEAAKYDLKAPTDEELKSGSNDPLSDQNETAPLSDDLKAEEDYAQIQTESLISEAARNNPARIRLQELDDQIARNYSRDSDATAISRKTRAENEWALWETELQRILNTLKENLDSKEQEALMQEQKDWMRSRENQAVDASKRQWGSTMEEVSYNSSLAELTRARAYELADAYAEIFAGQE